MTRVEPGRPERTLRGSEGPAGPLGRQQLQARIFTDHHGQFVRDSAPPDRHPHAVTGPAALDGFFQPARAGHRNAVERQELVIEIEASLIYGCVLNGRRRNSSAC